jgi:hypothetical protein
MSAVPAALAFPSPQLSAFEAAFIRTVLEHRGTASRPTLAEVGAAADVLRRYGEECERTPRSAWQPDVGEDTRAELSAKTFLMFGTTAPTPAQWQKAHAALYGPLLCETCG